MSNEKPFVFIINFADVETIPDIDEFVNSINAQWHSTNVPFANDDNPHKEQVIYSLERLFEKIMEYAKTGLCDD